MAFFNRKAHRAACPCCGYLTLPLPREKAAGFICPVCFWENDVFSLTEEEPSDCNHGLTLPEGRENFRRFGTCTEDCVKHVRKPQKFEQP